MEPSVSAVHLEDGTLIVGPLSEEPTSGLDFVKVSHRGIPYFMIYFRADDMEPDIAAVERWLAGYFSG